ncbi:MFS transporter [Novosphingobium sp. MMS21-SN21R]|uniref:spinster family MFS transporter n=1 Tax=Novosphingobium sp. MMS21-SN21R TaxID=2969298 RepID=UPI0028880925|nr:MFS transporter [Novosphingobium sp. MMS21-SN21R]MDT0509716.1 MFS transporter [Novosphingobium sp. MMS21-SN21R]
MDEAKGGETPPVGSEKWFLLLLGLVYMMNFIDRTIISVAGEAIRRDLGLTDLQLGLLGGLAFSLFYAALGIPLARLAERRSRVGLIAIVTTIWSVMTALTGAAGSFVQLLICRMGVGVGEAGFTPALVSMISDRFPEERRASAFSTIAIWVSIGGAVSATLGGWVVQTYGWRAAFVVLGLPGVILAVLLRLTIPEPPRRNAGDAAATPTFGAVLRRVGRSPAFLYLTAASGLVGMVSFGLNLFMIPLLVRRYGLDIAQAGLIFAVALSLSMVIGNYSGGRAADWLGRRDVGWFGRAPAMLLVVSLPLYLLAILQSDWRWFLVLMFFAAASLNAFLPAIMTVTQRLVEPRMRASAAALHAFGQTVAGLGIGSVALGWLSDRLAAQAYGGDYRADCARKVVEGACLTASATGLQHAMMAAGTVLLGAIVFYFRAAHALRRELPPVPAPA